MMPKIDSYKKETRIASENLLHSLRPVDVMHSAKNLQTFRIASHFPQTEPQFVSGGIVDRESRFDIFNTNN
jgi:hypothetical protein